MPMQALPDGFVIVAKRDCPTCELVVPVMREIADKAGRLTVLTQDDPHFPPNLPNVVDDTDLERSWHLHIESVPTLLRIEGGRETARAFGWHRGEWEALTGIAGLGNALPAERPGCGSRTLDPGLIDELAIRFGNVTFKSRQVEIGGYEDEIEACFDREWSDGLPVVPPTPVRVHRMLQATKRDPMDVLGAMPPDYQPCTVEKVAINAVMAGCKPEYFPVVLAAVEAALDDRFCLHGVIATTMFIGPIVIVNGPIRRMLGMNSGVNVLGQGNRANNTIGRALQLAIRNIGGGKPGMIDRATLGSPSKVGFCFAEDEEGSCWESLAEERGVPKGGSAVTLFAGFGVTGMVDQNSRTPESLARSFAATLRGIHHVKGFPGPDAFVVISPEHQRTFREAGWSKARLKQELHALTTVPAEQVMAGADGMAAGVPQKLAGKTVRKFRPEGLNIVHAGGTAGMFSGILPGWSAGADINSSPVTKEIAPWQ
jgi:hypothetical protein